MTTDDARQDAVPARAAPHASAAQLNEAQQLAEIGSWEFDPGSRELLWSEETFRIFEIDPNRTKASYDLLLDRIHPDDRAGVDAAYDASLASGQPYDIEHRLCMPDGRIKYVQERGITHYAADGQPQRTLGTVQDITARRAIEQELREKSAALTERLKEMSCVSQAIEILSRTDQPLAILLQQLLELIPPAMVRPELAGAQLQLNELELRAAAFDPEAEILQQPITVDGREVGRLSVSCKPGTPPRDRSPFLYEEKQLVRLLALKIGQHIERRDDQERFRMLLETAPDATVIVDEAGLIRLVNSRTEELFGYGREELIGQPVEMLVPERFVESHRRHRGAYRRDPKVRPMGSGLDLQARRRDGSEFPVEISLSALQSAQGLLISSTIRDVSERRHAEDMLQRLIRMRTMMSEINAVIVRASDRETLLEDACRIAVERGGFRLAWVGLKDDGGDLKPIAFSGDAADYLRTMSVSPDPKQPRGQGPGGRALRTGRCQAVNDIARDPSMAPWRDGALAAGLRSLATLPLKIDQQVVGIISLYADVTDFFDAEELALLDELAADVSFSMASIAQRERLGYLAYFDPLTALANRRLFNERFDSLIQGARSTGRPVALLLLDLERFKSVNDVLGGDAGDALLKIVAGRLTAVAGSDDFVARTGGDQFALIVPQIEDAAKLTRLVNERITPALAEPLELAGEQLHPGARVGIALHPADGDSAESLFRNAEAALKQAKQRGERLVFYAEDMNRSVRRKLRLQNRLRQALQNAELTLHYQPKVDLQRGQICGAEALLRWPGGTALGISCGDTIEMLEASGEILQVGRQVLRQARRDRRAWQQAGLRAPPVAVNVSVLQLQQPDFADGIRALLQECGAEHCGLELELTESTLMHDVEGNLAKLQQICDLGVPIAIDDFGTGYSSLSYLSRLPISALKIDHSFIADLTTSPDAMSIVSTIISLAHSMNLKVIAEGVETEEQLKFLRLLRCDEMQGFLLSPALPAKSFAQWLGAGPPALPGQGRSVRRAAVSP